MFCKICHRKMQTCQNHDMVNLMELSRRQTDLNHTDNIQVMTGDDIVFSAKAHSIPAAIQSVLPTCRVA